MSNTPLADASDRGDKNPKKLTRIQVAQLIVEKEEPKPMEIILYEY